MKLEWPLIIITIKYTECVDEGDNCEKAKEVGACNQAIIQAFCKKTCGVC